QQQRLDRGAFAPGWCQAAEVLRVFPVQREGDESPTTADTVDRQVLVDEVDAVREVGELTREVLERRQAADPERRRAVHEHVVADDRVPAVERNSLERFVQV